MSEKISDDLFGYYVKGLLGVGTTLMCVQYGGIICEECIRLDKIIK